MTLNVSNMTLNKTIYSRLSNMTLNKTIHSRLSNMTVNKTNHSRLSNMTLNKAIHSRLSSITLNKTIHLRLSIMTLNKTIHLRLSNITPNKTIHSRLSNNTLNKTIQRISSKNGTGHNQQLLIFQISCANTSTTCTIIVSWENNHVNYKLSTIKTTTSEDKNGLIFTWKCLQQFYYLSLYIVVPKTACVTIHFHLIHKFIVFTEISD